MRIDVSEAVQCGCDTCVQHRTFITQETEPTNVTVTSVPVSSGLVQALGSTSDQSSGTETTPLAHPPPATTTSVIPEPAQSVDTSATSSKSSPVQTSSPPTIFSFPPPVSSALRPTGSLPGPFIGCSFPIPTSGPSISSSSQASVTNLVGSADSRPSRWGPVQDPPLSSGLVTPSQLLRWGSVKAPVQASAPDTSKTASALPPPFSGCRGKDHFSSPFGPTQNFSNNGVCASRTTPKHPFPGFSVDYLPTCPSNLFGPNPQTTPPVSGRSPFLASGQGSRYPRYSPTPGLDCFGGQGKVMSISASNSHGHKSHEELRWEDYKNGDKGGVRWFPPAHKPRKESRWDQDYKNGDKGGFERYPPPDHTPSVFNPPSRPDRPRQRYIDLTHRDLSGFPLGYNTPTAFQSPHEPVGVSSPASACTACGATSSSSPSVHLGFNGTTNPPSAATSLPGLLLSTYGSFPLLFATPNLAAHGIIATPAVQAYAMILGTNFTSQGTTATPVKAYPMMFGTPNHVAQGTTTTPAAQPYSTMFGTPSLAAQGTTTTPAAQPYPMMFGTPNLGAQGITPPIQPYAMIFGTPNLGAQGITPPVQPYAMMFGTPNLLPFSAMSLQ